MSRVDVVPPHTLRLWTAWRTACVTLALLAMLSAFGGCATSHPHRAIEQEDSLEAQPLPDNDSLADKAGEMGVVGVLVTAIVGGILLPIFLL